MAFPGAPHATPYAEFDSEHYDRRRRRVFFLSSLAVLLIGVAWTLFQPRVYESSATVLMSAPTAIDERMIDADVQGVAIQRRILTGSEVARGVTETLADEYGTEIDPFLLRGQMVVTAVPETNLLELAVRGDESLGLPLLVETWIDVYSSIRARDIAERKTRTESEVQSEIDGLAARIESAREKLDNYRAEHGIISAERQENEVLSRLNGLNQSLNAAIEEEVRARAYLNTLRASLADGEQVVPETARGEVEAMAEQLASLRTELAELRARYTDEYIAKDPRLREIPQQIVELESELAAAYDDGSRQELGNAERAYRAARESVGELEQRLAQQQREVGEFNTVYATHSALVADLERLEELHREAQARLVQVQVRQLERYPQLSVVEWPDTQARRVGPPYLLLLGGTALAALLVGIFAVWLFTYLHPRKEPRSQVTISGVHLYPDDAARALGRFVDVERLPADEAKRLGPADGGGARRDDVAGAEDGNGGDRTP